MNYKVFFSGIAFTAIIGIQNAYCQADKDLPFKNTVSGIADKLPAGYVPPLVSNGSLSMLVDYQGCQFQSKYGGMIPEIWWEGRRYSAPNAQLIPFGHFDQELTVDGVKYTMPETWTQTLNTKEAFVTCRNDYGNLVVETIVFTPMSHDMIVIKKRFSTKTPIPCSSKYVFKYQFTSSGNETKSPARTTMTQGWDSSDKEINYNYRVEGYNTYDGIISVLCDKPVTSASDLQLTTMSADITLSAKKTYEMTFYLIFTDSMDGENYRERAKQVKNNVLSDGFDTLFTQHKKEWKAYCDESFVHLPDLQMEKTYNTAQYHLRANATKWSFPVGIFDTHWAGRFFGWDEMFCFLGIASSNHLDISKRVPDFRYDVLQKARQRVYHKSRPYGARYPWETIEDGTEASPPGYWYDHVFHMSNIALSSWYQYLYTGDVAYLNSTAYPVIKECALFYMTHMIYNNPDGSLFIGKCTDLERLGPAKQNPFMTSCGVIFTLDAASRAASILNIDDTLSTEWKDTAGKLKKSLPNNGVQYIPYAGCKDESIAVMGGIFPYPVFDADNDLQKNAIYWFVKNGRASGNMYPIGNSVCPWYAGWMASALAMIGDKTEPAKLLTETTGTVGCFSELFEINEPKVVMHPWFSTASGNFIYALNQMLIQSHGNQISIAPAVPAGWKEFSFKLASFDNLAVSVEIQKGIIVKLVMIPGDQGKSMIKKIVIPAYLIDNHKINKDIVSSVTEKEGNCYLDIKFTGISDVIGKTKR